MRFKSLSLSKRSSIKLIHSPDKMSLEKENHRLLAEFIKDLFFFDIRRLKIVSRGEEKTKEKRTCGIREKGEE